MSLKIKFLLYFLSVFSFFGAAVETFAQDAPASLSGKISDNQGAVVAGASITLAGENRASEKRIQSDSNGEFRFDNLSKGTYLLTVTQSGFKAVTREVLLDKDAAEKLEIALGAGEISETVSVTATRSVTEISTIPGAVSVITREDLADQNQTGIGLADALGKTVPGLAASNQSLSVFGQTLRGRPFQVLIDGIPQSTSRNVARDLQTIDNASIERVEVVRGTTAIYGDGATGGIVNIITRPPVEDGFRFSLDVGSNFSLTHPDGSLGGYVRPSIAGKINRFDYFVSGTLEKTGAFFDADGLRIPPDPNGQGGLADARNYNVFTKFGYALTNTQRLGLTFNRYRNLQETSFGTDPTVAALAPRTRARAICCISLDEEQGTTNTFFNLDYTNNRFLNTATSFHAQAYYRDFFSRFFPFDGRAFASFGNAITQSFVDSIKRGGRLEFSTPVAGSKFSLLYGADFSGEGTAQPVTISDTATFVQSGGRIYRTVGDRTFTPYISQKNFGAFLQAEYRPFERTAFRAGIRHERIGLDIPGFRTLGGNNITGGELDYDATLFNVGGTYNFTDTLNFFANFSQGFSVADVGRTLRNAPAGFSVAALRPEAQKVDNYETGLRYTGGRVQSSLSLFYNRSNLGTSFNPQLEIVRAPERVYGAEADVYFQPIAKTRFGATATWLEGESDPNLDGIYTYLTNDRIPPFKATAFAEYDFTSKLRTRLQTLYSGNRTRFGNVFAFGTARIDDFIVFDLLGSYRFKRGTLRVGIENLFNNLYYPPASQFNGSNAAFAAARGAQLSVGYTIDF